MKLKNKTYLVTGGSRGIGAGIALELASEGAQVAITYSTNEEAAQKVISSLPGSGHLSVQMNLTAKESVDAALVQVLGHFPKLDGLVNNAGITKDQLLLRMKPEDFDEVIATNLRGHFLCIKGLLKHFVKQKKGSIVNITSISGQRGTPGQTNYAASKAGIEAFGKSLAQELGSRALRVNCVAPGFIRTDMTDALADEQKDHIFKNIPLGHFGEVKDVAACVAFLMSEDARYITGQTISVNGGLYM